MDDLTIAPPQRDDKPAWRRLYDGYATFYKRTLTDEVADAVWSWLHDPTHPMQGLVARDGTGKLLGLAHFRAMPRPLTGSTAGFLDDLFVDPEVRGRRVGARLIKAMEEEGRRQGWTIIRWLTADDNYRARTLYDHVATRTMWITYQLDL